MISHMENTLGKIYLRPHTAATTVSGLLWGRLICLMFALNPGSDPCFVACVLPIILMLLVLPSRGTALWKRTPGQNSAVRLRSAVSKRGSFSVWVGSVGAVRKIFLLTITLQILWHMNSFLLYYIQQREEIIMSKRNLKMLNSEYIAQKINKYFLELIVLWIYLE